MVWYSHLFIMIHTVIGVVNETEVDVFPEFPCFLCDPANVGDLISDSTACSKPSLDVCKFLVYILLKPCAVLSHSVMSDSLLSHGL